MQADTFDEELKKLVGMGFEKVLQGCLERQLRGFPYCVSYRSMYTCAMKHLTDVVITSLQTQAEVALAAADGDPNVAIEILMSQQV